MFYVPQTKGLLKPQNGKDRKLTTKIPSSQLFLLRDLSMLQLPIGSGASPNKFAASRKIMKMVETNELNHVIELVILVITQSPSDGVFIFDEAEYIMPDLATPILEFSLKLHM